MYGEIIAAYIEHLWGEKYRLHLAVYVRTYVCVCIYMYVCACACVCIYIYKYIYMRGAR